MIIIDEDIEFIIHCEPNGRIIGPISRKHAHLPGVRPVLTHYSTWSMIFNTALGKYGIQRKNPKKSDTLGAGRWDMGVAGHNYYAMDKKGFRPIDFDENLVKEAQEEIGITVKMFPSREEFVKASKRMGADAIGHIFERFHYAVPENNEWVGLGLILTTSTHVTFTDKEVVEFRWLTPEELKAFLMTETNLCATLPLAFEKAEAFRSKYLSS